MRKLLSFLLAAAMTTTIAVTALATTESTITLGPDASSNISLDGGLLKPGEEYRFPVSVALNGNAATPLTDELLKDYSFKVTNNESGKTIESFKLSKASSVYYLVAPVKAGWPAQQTDEGYTFKLVNKADGKTAAELKVAFSTGYGIVDDAIVDNMKAEDYITIDVTAPIYTKQQIERIAKLNNYKKVIFSGSNWTYEVNATDMPNINMLYNNSGIKEVLSKYEDNSFEFVTFPAGTQFKQNGTFKMDVSTLSDDYNQTFFVYRYLDGKLTAVPATFDASEDILSFNTNTLGRFVITDKQIKDAVVVPPSSNGGNGNDNSNGSGNGNGSGNPNTGASASAVMIALSALTALAGGVALKKRK